MPLIDHPRNSSFTNIPRERLLPWHLPGNTSSVGMETSTFPLGPSEERGWGGDKSSAVTWSVQRESLRFERGGGKRSPTRSRNHESKISRALQIGNRQVVNPRGSSVPTALLIHPPSARVRAGRGVRAWGVMCFRRPVSFVGVMRGG